MPANPLTLQQLRRYAIARSLFAPTTLTRAIGKLGFLQADPIRAPARAQDLMLRHRVKDYRAGDLERSYPRLAVEEDFFINYGFLPRPTYSLMHPRQVRTPWSKAREAQAHAVLAFVHARKQAHPREVEAEFQHGTSKNWFGGNSNASTQLLDAMHYRGLLRVARRDSGTRVYAAVRPHEQHLEKDAAMDALVDVIVRCYAPLPEQTLSQQIHHLRAAAPQWTDDRKPAIARAKQRLPNTVIDGQRWFWPAEENPSSKRHRADLGLRLLAPFDPVVWDRRRFELFWGWAYRFEAYVPAPQRLRGYYALPLLWRDQVIGWCNLKRQGGRWVPDLGFVSGRPPTVPGFKAALDEELQRMTLFLTPR